MDVSAINSKDWGVASAAEIIAENKRRLDKLNTPYDPISGVGSPIDRFKVEFSALNLSYRWFLPKSMENIAPVILLKERESVEALLKHLSQEATTENVSGFMRGFINDRFAHDFEFWAASCARIQPVEGDIIPFVCNRAQRKILRIIEADRRRDVQGLYNLLKCRQFGGSTFTRIYFTWVQLYIIPYAWCAIVAEVQEQADVAVKMLETMAEHLPKEVGILELKNMQGKKKGRELIFSHDSIVEKRGNVTVGSVEKPHTLRGRPWRLLHATEVGLWGETYKKSAKALNQAITSGMPINTSTWIIHMRESTAKGLNYFYEEWNKAERGESSYRNIFVATFEMPKYQSTITRYDEYIDEVNAMPEGDRMYALFMWNKGATLEAIKWWFLAKKDFGYDDQTMLEEYPNDPMDAFRTSGKRVFPPKYVENVRATCCPARWVGDITASARSGKEAFEEIELNESTGGRLYVWSKPDASIKVKHRYCVAVDIGGRWKGADYSVIRVFDRIGLLDGGLVEVVATWRGHLDKDLVAWKAAQLAYWYGNALLVVENNSLTKLGEDSPGAGFLTILNEIVGYYSNIYSATSSPEKIKEGKPRSYGWNTNASSREMVINTFIKVARESSYIERYEQVPYEMERFVVKSSGKMEHMDNEKDDCVICSAIGLHICLEIMPPPTVIVERTYSPVKLPAIESTLPI